MQNCLGIRPEKMEDARRWMDNFPGNIYKTVFLNAVPEKAFLFLLYFTIYF
jgi:hypothetical protein